MKIVLLFFAFSAFMFAEQDAYFTNLMGYSLIFLIFVIMVFFYRQYLLKGKNEELEKLQDKLIELNHVLESKVVRANDDLQKAQEITKIGSWILDVLTNDLRCSLQTFKIFEIDIKDHNHLYDEFINRVHPEDRNRVKRVYKKSLIDKQNYKQNYRLLMKDGSIKYILEHCETSFNKDGEALVSYGTVQDITEAVEQKMKIEAKERQLLHKFRLIQMGEMLSMIAHQWKQPLGSISASQISILSAIDLEVYDLDDKKQREEFLKFSRLKLNKIATYVRNLSQVISDFSDYYRPAKKSQEVIFDSVVLKSKTLFIDMLKSSKIEVNLDLDTNCGVYVHESELMQVILNIVTNARDQFVDKEIKDAKIEIRTYKDGNNVFIEISDNAGGIDEEIINKIFDPYFSTKLEKNGTGLGLYMSRSIVEDYHSGSIDVFNIENGVTFRIRISTERRKVDRDE